ncbi:hypothetical protein PVAP13_1KG167705 [Panicum virgatum]|uniref:Uncharacterized protein n=1 Tax=Panicum virgatum TaxID=38727 RepID=A0A8T0XDA8_PANVG|nr:hypothetical protein PVAP13_1KG167705 [Panicum virgatum]
MLASSSMSHFSAEPAAGARHALRIAVGGPGAHGSRHPATALLPVQWCSVSFW